MGSLGADESGEDMTVGRTNKSEERTILLAINGENAPNGYADDFVLSVSIQNDAVLTSTPGRGVDAIHAKGMLPLPTGGAMGTIPAGNGIIAQGINGVAGYVHATSRNRPLENSVGAGLLGVGSAASAGVFGTGQNGVVGIEQTTTRDLAFEAAQKAGVLGRGETGVSGDGANGAGVFGRGLPGVQGQSSGGPGVQSTRMAQLWLIPLRIKDPTALAKSTAGELLSTVWPDERGTEITSLWFCTRGGDPTQASWAKLA
jgi:hypothetical protein